MATAKSVLTIDVNDAAFKAFNAAFAKYQQAVNNMPAAWSKVGSSAQAAMQPITTAAHQLTGATNVLQNVVTAQTNINKQSKETEKSWLNISKSFKSALSSAAGISFNVLKWAAIGGFGGAFGMRELGQSASDLRRTSLGLGVKPGDLRAAQNVYGKYFDAQSVLGNIATEQSTTADRGYLYGLGLSESDIKNKSAADLLPQLIPKIIEKWKQGGSTAESAHYQGLDKIFDLNTLRELSKISPDELGEASADYGQKRGEFGVDDDTLQKWQKFNTALGAAGTALETDLIKRLVTLGPAIIDLADKFRIAADRLFGAGGWGDKAGEHIANGIEKAFGDGTPKSSAATTNGADKSHWWDYTATRNGVKNGPSGLTEWWDGDHWWNHNAVRNGSKGTTSSSAPSVSNPISSAFHGVLDDDNNPLLIKAAKGSALAQFKSNINALNELLEYKSNLSNPDDLAEIGKEISGWEKRVINAGRHAGLGVTIQDATGGSVIVTINQMAH